MSKHLISSLLLCCAIADANADPKKTTAVEEETVLDEVLVTTATKTERRIKDVTSSVSVITKEQIEKSPATTVDQLLRGIPGVYATRMDALSPNRIAQTYTRGLPGNGRSLVLIDDVPMNVAYDSQVDWSQLGTIDVERVEVVRGAGSALYGNHAMGGVINVMSKAISPGFKGRVEADYGRMSTTRGAGQVSYGTDNAGVSLSASYLESEGYNMWRPDTNPTNTPPSQQTKTGTQKFNAGAKIFYNINSRNLLDFSFSYLNDIASGLYDIPDYIPQDREQYLGSARYRYLGDSSESTVLVYSRFGKMAADSVNAPNATSPDVSVPASRGIRGATLISYRGDFDDREIGVRAQTSHQVGDYQKITFGGQYSDSEMTMTNLYPAEVGRTQITHGNSKLSGIFLQDEFDFGALKLNIAGRWDLWQTSGRFSDTKTTFPGQGTWSERSVNAFSPKGGFSYRVIDDFIVRGSIGKSFNTPDISQMYGNSRRGTTVAYGNPQLAPEKALSADFGLDYYFGKTAYLKTTFYHTTAKDFIATIQRVGSPVGTTDKVNYGGVRAMGVELEGMWQVADWLTLRASYSKNDSIITKFTQNPALKGKQLTNVPRDQANVRADFTLPYGIGAFANVNYVGDRFSVENNSTNYRRYTTYDLGFTKTLYKDISARLLFNNIGNNQYEGIGYIAPGFVMSGGIVAKF